MKEVTFEPAFEIVYSDMLAKAIKESKGERKRKLLEDHGQGGEKVLAYVWWKAVGNLDYLHPEYELFDFKDGLRFADYAYLPNKFWGMLLECDGGSHWRDLNKWKFGDDRERQNHALLDGWKLLRFSYDQLAEKPGRCQQTILMALAKWGRTQNPADATVDVYERAILHYIHENQPDKITPALICEVLTIAKDTARNRLKLLDEKKYLLSVKSRTGRVMSFIVRNSGK